MRLYVTTSQLLELVTSNTCRGPPQAREELLYLAKFENDWATAQIVIQYFMN